MASSKYNLNDSFEKTSEIVSTSHEGPSDPQSLKPTGNVSNKQLLGMILEMQKKTSEQISHLNQKTSEQDRVISEQDRAISNLNQKTSDLNQKTFEQDRVIPEQDRVISQLYEKTSEQDREISHLNQKTSEQDRVISHLNEKASEQDRVISEQDRVISQLYEKTSEQDREISHLNQKTSEQDNDIDQLEERITNLDEKIFQQDLEISVLRYDNDVLKLKEEELNEVKDLTTKSEQIDEASFVVIRSVKDNHNHPAVQGFEGNNLKYFVDNIDVNAGGIAKLKESNPDAKGFPLNSLRPVSESFQPHKKKRNMINHYKYPGHRRKNWENIRNGALESVSKEDFPAARAVFDQCERDMEKRKKFSPPKKIDWTNSA